jgi:Protein of unknown function (DUF2846)
MTADRAGKIRGRIGLAGLLVAVGAGCAMLPASNEARGTAPPIPAGQARIWVYREWLPSESLNLANVDVNGSYFGSVANGASFYRDVAPGRYRIVPQSYNHDFSQDSNVQLAQGQQAYVKILSMQNWDGACRDCVRDTFYAWLIAPSVAQAEIARGRG